MSKIFVELNADDEVYYVNPDSVSYVKGDEDTATIYFIGGGSLFIQMSFEQVIAALRG